MGRFHQDARIIRGAFTNGGNPQPGYASSEGEYRGWATTVPSPTQSVLPPSMNAPTRRVVQFGMKGCVVGHTCRSFARASLTSSLRSIAQVGDAWRIERTRVTNALPHPVVLNESEESKLALGRTAAGSPRPRSLCFAAQRRVTPWGLVGRDFRCFAAAQHDRLARWVIRERARARPEIKYLLYWTTPQ